ncbi:MAG TPA: hypothetical protein P5309_10475 [Syntrophomonadaceae bacterium]|jgi:hypothetical protein|nr:hypothetical protein [Syntrophomonadaceae bacterium]
MSKTLLNSAELEMENPERLAQLIIDLSQIMDGAVEDPRKTFSYSLIQRVVTASSEELMALMRDPMRMLPLYYSVVQHVLLQHVEAPDDLEKILDTMESHQRSGTRDNEYLQVVKDTYTRTFNNTRAVYARMEKLSADLDRFEQQSDEQNEEFKEKMDALSVQLEREQREVFAKTDAMLKRLEELSNGVGKVDVEREVPKKDLITVGKNIETLLIAAVVVLFIIITAAILFM